MIDQLFSNFFRCKDTTSKNAIDGLPSQHDVNEKEIRFEQTRKMPLNGHNGH